MQVTYKLTEKDVLEAASTGAVRSISIIGFLMVAMGTFSMVTRSISYGPGLALIAIGLFFAFGTRLQLRASFRRDDKLQGQFEAVISEDFIEVSGPSATSKYDWSSFIRYVESKNLFLLYQSQHAFNIFPKRAFTSADLDLFRSILQENLGSASIAHNKKISPKTWVFLAGIAVAAILLSTVVIRNTR